MEQTEKRPGRPPKQADGGTKPVKLLKGYFPLNGGEKEPAGAEIDLPAEEARRAVEIGIGVRNDSF